MLTLPMLSPPVPTMSSTAPPPHRSIHPSRPTDTPGSLYIASQHDLVSTGIIFSTQMWDIPFDVLATRKYDLECAIRLSQIALTHAETGCPEESCSRPSSQCSSRVQYYPRACRDKPLGVSQIAGKGIARRGCGGSGGSGSAPSLPACTGMATCNIALAKPESSSAVSPCSETQDTV